ncbi:HlyD family type I secretion periplasmic adaptor subunit [Salipiger bermudensis]|uniref:HlyD family type I secretion periplasmic adaptor subunit n=1 Tax=Salipiger bermudensis TaxID=344736 RepID=UPI001C99BFFF|nr:HlyD family type I secretion periplasmic adaptor subunit [Salipiger bermudensis]MBY6006506.1 HlyD family type I secretion periplasmic adaptor subunit [Salipiger bermudensis]
MSELQIYDPETGWYAEVPRSIRRHAIIGILLMALAFGGFAYWSFTAPLAAAVIAPGSFVATGRNKIVQHLEGGIIQRIFIEEGQKVRQGDEILILDQTSAEANERELFLREMRLQATSDRLLAEYRELDRLRFTPALRNAAESDGEIAALLDSQQLTFEMTRKSMLNDIALLERNIEALKIRDRGFSEQLASLRLRSEILQEDIEAKTGLLEGGLIRKSELNALRRVQAEADGQVARLAAEVEEVQQMILKYEAEIARARSAHREAALEELAPIAADLESVREKARKARNVLSRSVVRAPVSGTVVRLHYHTENGVIEPGRAIAEILPADAPLIIETQIARTEIDSVSLGQTAIVRLSALNRRTTPVLNGVVDYVSADALREEIAGIPQEVYLARISITPEELSRARGLVATPGMPVEVMIQTQERTFFDYLTKPISDSFTRAFREQ